MIDFTQLGLNTFQKQINPRDIFMGLTNKTEKYQYPRDVQGEVWKQWFEQRNNRDTIIKMNTGSGKTVVALMILQSCLNEGIGPAKYRMIHVCNHEEGCLLMAQNMLNRTDELVLNIQGEGQMSIFDLMSDVSTDSSGKQITIQDVKDKMKEHLLNYNTGVHLSRLTAEFYVKYGLIGYISMVNDALKELEKDGYIQIVRQPQFSEKTNKPLKFMDEKGNHNVIIRRLQP